MKQLLLGTLAIVLIAVTHTQFTGASANDFTIHNFESDLYLNKDSEGRSTLRTVEKITADFPQTDQNHGLERALPLVYDGHSTSLHIQTVTSSAGQELTYSTHDVNGNRVIRIGDKDTYVHGLQTYVITYTERDVTRFFSDTNADEFYRNINGTGWRQPFNSVISRVHIGKELTSALTGNQSCYNGVSGSTDRCTIVRSGDVFSSEVGGLAEGENQTVAIGFRPHTFADYRMSLGEVIVKYIGFISIGTSAVLLGIIYLLRRLKGQGAPGRGIIIAEYLPPKDSDVATSSVIVNETATWAAAMYVDLAVRHKLRIIEHSDGASKKPSYSLELLGSDNLTPTEESVVKALFGAEYKIGASYEVQPSRADTKLASKLSLIYGRVKRDVRRQGYYIVNLSLQVTMIILALVIGAQALAVSMLFQDAQFVSVLPFIGLVGSAIGFVIISNTKPLSQKGRELSDYLKGLELYIEVAEEKRLQILQSPQGAVKTPIDTSDTAMLVRLYERVLPYAVLFGQENQWTKVLGRYYEQQNQSPDWYTGNAAFNAASFGSAFIAFSDSATNNSYVAPSSSSSGGSSGGGSSGGGGGGGGGGGW